MAATALLSLLVVLLMAVIYLEYKSSMANIRLHELHMEDFAEVYRRLDALESRPDPITDWVRASREDL